MKKVHPALLLTISDIMVNLSAGWFGAAFIVPVFSDKPLNLNFWILIVNLFFGTVFMLLAYRTRVWLGGRKIKW